MVTGVVSEHMVEFNIVDFICSLGLEAFLDDCHLLIWHLQSESVENWPETGERNEAGSAAVFVLEVGFDQQASVLHFDTKAFKTGNKYLLFFSIKHVLRVKNWRSIERIRSLSWVLFQGFIREDGIELWAESNIVDETFVIAQGEILLKFVVLCRR